MPIFEFGQNTFDPIELFVDIDFGLVLLYEWKESLVVNKTEFLDGVHFGKHVLFLHLSKNHDLVNIFHPFFMSDETVVAFINGPESIVEADFLFDSSLSQIDEKFVDFSIGEFLVLFFLISDQVSFDIFLSDNVVVIDVDLLNMGQNLFLWVRFKIMGLQVAGEFDDWYG